MNASDSITSPPILQRLIEGLAPPFEFDDLGSAPEALPDAVPLNWLGIVALGLLGLGMMIWAGWKWYRRRSIQALWPNLSHLSAPNADQDSAQSELTLLEFLVSLTDEKARQRAALWHALTPSERTVALATLNDEPTQDLAQRLVCTTSHVYNLRASIRKKWNLDPDLPLRVAIAQVLEEEANAMAPANEADGSAT